MTEKFDFLDEFLSRGRELMKLEIEENGQSSRRRIKDVAANFIYRSDEDGIDFRSREFISGVAVCAQEMATFAHIPLMGIAAEVSVQMIITGFVFALDYEDEVRAYMKEVEEKKKDEAEEAGSN